MAAIPAGNIALKRAYDEPSREDGTRILVDRLWPRGVTKKNAAIDRWAKELAPSTELRKWFSHDPAKWAEFQRRYICELDANPQAWQPLVDAARNGDVTLLYSSRDRDHDNSVALRDYLLAHLRNG